MGLILLLVLVSAACTALLGTPLARSLGRRLGVVDRPGGRKAHEGAVPMLGGAAVLAGFLAPIALGVAVLVLFPDEVAARWRPHLDVAAERAHALSRLGSLAGLVLGALILFAVGVADDVIGDRLPWWAKLLGQVAGAAAAVASGAVLDVLGHPGLNAVGSVLWIVTIANAMNFLDHADGVCAGVALIAGAVLLGAAWLLEQYLVALVLAALVGSLAGFLPYNARGASIFLGDGGSQTIGFLLGALSALESYVAADSPGYVPTLLPLLALGLPLFDMFVVVVRRWRAGAPVYVGDRTHLHHRLSALGMTPWQATLTVWLAAIVLGAGGVLLPFASPLGATVILVQALGAMGLIAALMLFGARREPPDPGPKG